MSEKINYVGKGAIFSEDRKHRFALHRVWDLSLSTIMFVGLNPSTANGNDDDPTIRKVVKFAKDWGWGGVTMVNCFSFVSTDPNGLDTKDMLERNDIVIKQEGDKAAIIIFAWGNWDVVVENSRDIALTQMFPHAKCLIKNKNGSPRHPLYVPGNTVPIDW